MSPSANPIQGILVGIALFVSGLLPSQADDDRVGVEVKAVRTDKLANAPGQVLTAVTVHYAPGGRSKPHHHAGSVFVYVLTGAIRSENSVTGPAKVYRAGESFFEPEGSVHLVSENASATEPASLLAVFVAAEGAELTTFEASKASPSKEPSLARQIFETMIQAPGVTSGHRPVHAKGIVCQGSFTPTKEAAAVSRARHFRDPSTAVTVRLSDGASDPSIPDGSPRAGPRGMAIRFNLPGGEETDIVAISHNGFIVGTGQEFLALQKAVVSTDPAKPHPWPIELFVSARPLALKFVQDNARVPASFANESFFSNHAFIFVNQDGVKQTVRYRILPKAGPNVLGEAEAKARSADFLVQDFKMRLGTGAVDYRVVVQLPNPGDPTDDSSLVWPDDRRTIEMGTIRVTSLVADNSEAEKALAFDPTNLIEGIELSDDPLPALRSSVYAMSVRHRHQR